VLRETDEHLYQDTSTDPEESAFQTPV